MENKGKRMKYCGICDSDATCLCFICYNYFCESCFKLVHEKKKLNHKKEKIDPYLQFDFKCPEHQRGLLDLFCIEEKGNTLFYNLIIIILELCCPYCLYENLHEKHKVLKVSDEELLKKEDITLESSTKIFNDIVNNIKTLKENIEKEISKINNLYEEVNSNLTKAYQEKHEQLLKEENDIREKLQNEVTKTKEKLEYFFSETNNELILNERINSGLKYLEKEEKNNLRILLYISQMNKNNKNMNKLLQEKIKGKKFYFDEKENNIKYEEYIFNGLPIPNDIKFEGISNNSVNLSWNIDNNDLINEKINYRVEMKEENGEKFEVIYEGADNKYTIKNLIPNNYYIIRICCMSNDYIGQWSLSKRIKIKVLDKDFGNSKIIKSKEEQNQIIEWLSKEGNLKNIKLIYRATEDGDKSEQLIEKIKNKGPIISLIQTKKGKRFGGFTKVDWDESGTNKNDPNAFLFSLDNKCKYKILKSNLAFAYYSSEPLVYGNDGDGKGIYLKENFLKDKYNNEDHSTRVYDVPSDYCLTGENNFEVEEVEIFQIIYE